LFVFHKFRNPKGAKDTSPCFPGNLTIPKLNAILPIYHSTDEDEHEKGVGHFAGSVLPGKKDNSVLSGHRDTVFASLAKLSKGICSLSRQKQENSRTRLEIYALSSQMIGQ